MIFLTSYNTQQSFKFQTFFRFKEGIKKLFDAEIPLPSSKLPLNANIVPHHKMKV